MDTSIIITLIVVIAVALVAIVWIVAQLTPSKALDKIADVGRDNVETVLKAMGLDKWADAIGSLPDATQKDEEKPE